MARDSILANSAGISTLASGAWRPAAQHLATLPAYYTVLPASTGSSILATRLYTNPTDEPNPDTTNAISGASLNENGTNSNPCATTMLYVAPICTNITAFIHWEIFCLIRTGTVVADRPGTRSFILFTEPTDRVCCVWHHAIWDS